MPERGRAIAIRLTVALLRAVSQMGRKGAEKGKDK